MIPPKCIDDILHVIEEQESKQILFISDGEEASEALFRQLTLNAYLNVAHYNGEDINEPWDVILISDHYVVRDPNLCTTLEELLNYINHSLIVVSPTYFDANGQACSIDGARPLHPVRFANFDFCYVDYDESEGLYEYSTYNFFKKCAPAEQINQQFCLKEQATISDTNHKLNILFALPHLKLTGGIKCLLTHARYLHKRGHNVYLMRSRSEYAIPDWSDIVDGVDITGQFSALDDDAVVYNIYDKKIDIIVLGYYTQIQQFIGLELPLIFWEQGTEYLYGDYKRLMSHNDASYKAIKKLYTLPCMLATVSPFLASLVYARFGRTSPQLYTGIDTSMYYPLLNKPDTTDIPRILLVGNPFFSFKGFSFALTALSALYLNGYRFTVTWACQKKPNLTVPFPLEYKVCVPQDELASLYRSHDIYLNTSLYEAFSMPPLEAMSSGIPVIATDCGGIHTYAKPGENLLLVEQGNYQELMASIIYLLENPTARRILGENGRKTALEFSVEKTNEQMEELLYQTIECYKNNHLNSLQIVLHHICQTRIDTYHLGKAT